MPRGAESSSLTLWEAVPMGYRPENRMDALLDELCVTHGWCLSPQDKAALIAAEPRDREAIVDSIIRAEYGESDVRSKDRRAYLMPIVDDWLFDPAGRGARSGLPL